MSTSNKEDLKQGLKFDNGKVRLDLIPPEAVFALGEILTFGAQKYADRNWELGMKWGRVFGAALRHMFKWASGDKLDEETGKSHLWHALCCLVFLVTYEMRGVGENDIHQTT